MLPFQDELALFVDTCGHQDASGAERCSIERARRVDATTKAHKQRNERKNKQTNKNKQALGFCGPVTGVIWALWAQIWKKSPKMSSRGVTQSPKRSRKRVKLVSILALCRLPFRLFGSRGREASGTHFRPLFPTLGPKGPNDTCSGQKFSQNKQTKHGSSSSNNSKGKSLLTRCSRQHAQDSLLFSLQPPA